MEKNELIITTRRVKEVSVRSGALPRNGNSLVKSCKSQVKNFINFAL